MNLKNSQPCAILAFLLAFNPFLSAEGEKASITVCANSNGSHVSQIDRGSVSAELGTKVEGTYPETTLKSVQVKATDQGSGEITLNVVNASSVALTTEVNISGVKLMAPEARLKQVALPSPNAGGATGEFDNVKPLLKMIRVAPQYTYTFPANAITTITMVNRDGGTTTPVARQGGDWMWKHTQKLAQAQMGDVDLLFIGDSITQFFDKAGSKVWAKYYEHRNALNLGFSGDKTENVLWRLDNGEIDGISPKLAIVMVGTNNTGHLRDQPEQIRDGIQSICERLRAKLPNTKILLIAIFPRGASAGDRGRMNNEAVNKLIANLADGKSIFFQNINANLLQPDGTLSKEVMPDLLHPNEKGYEIWAEAMEPTIIRLMGGGK